jgi:hypothetical protein
MKTVLWVMRHPIFALHWALYRKPYSEGWGK